MYSIFIVYGVMIMIMTFFQAIGDGKTAGVLVMLKASNFIYSNHDFSSIHIWSTEYLVCYTYS